MQNMDNPLKEWAARYKAETSLFEFVKQAWPQIEGDNPFVPSWHIEAICEHLEAASRGQIKKLLISVPPRTSKTTIISIMWPSWAWLKNPGLKFLFSSYAQKISWEHSRLCRMLIESPWYSYWNHIVKLSPDQATKGHFTTTALGHRIATSVGAGGTALGGDVLVMDDPNEAGESVVVSESTNSWVSRVWPSRLNPGGLGVNVLVQQRIREMDVTGYWLSRDENDEIVKLILPMEFESSRRAKTIILPSSNGKVWQDPRTKEGELLCPAYLDQEAIKRKKIELGAFNYAGQYQQRPAPEGGGIIQAGWFQWLKAAIPKITYSVQSWDTALTANELSSYSACTTWGIFIDKDKIANLLLLSAWRGRVSYPELLKRAERLRNNYLDVGEEPLQVGKGKCKPDEIVVEAKASGHTLISDFVSKGINVKSFDPGKYGDKLQRVHLCTPYIEAKLVWVMAQPKSYTSLYPDDQMVVDMCALFPNSESRDVVDTMSQAIIYCAKKKGLLKHRMEYGFKSQAFGNEHQPGFAKPPKEKNRGYFNKED